MNESDMENAFDVPNFPNICRICLETKDLQLFNEEYLMDVFKTITSIEVENEGFSLYICKDCLQRLEEITDFGDMARYNNTEYRNTWMRRTKLKGGMKENAVISNDHIEPKIKKEFISFDCQIKQEELHLDTKEDVLLDTDSEMTNNATLSNNHSGPTVKVEPTVSFIDKIKEVALKNPLNLMTIPLPNNQGEAKVEVQLSNIDSDSSETILMNSLSDVTNEVILLNKQGVTTKTASFFSNISNSVCSSDTMDQNPGVVTVRDSESEPESRDLSFISHLQVGHNTFTGEPDRHRNFTTIFLDVNKYGLNPTGYYEPNRNKPQMPRQRHVYTPHQLAELEKEFAIDPFPTIQRRLEMATSLGILNVKVKVWFQNRRMKFRKEAEKSRKFLQKQMEHPTIQDVIKGMEPPNSMNID